jgi:hypothetical protein
VYALLIFLKEKDKSDEYTQKIASIIRATTFNHVPQIFEKIIRDADYFHFTADNYSIKCKVKKRISTNKGSTTDL